SKIGDVGACPDTGHGIYHCRDITCSTVGRARSLLVLGAAVGVMVASLRAMQVTEPGNYVGPGSCSATACHGAIRPVAGARILQTEYTTWIAQDRHTRATDVLSDPVSERMARILGIGDSAKAPKCLACHSLDVPAAAQG